MTDNAFFADTGIQKTNVTEFSVSEISASLKRAVEDRFGHVRVRGEISGYRGPHSSGHCYFSLKDERARLEAVIWRGVYGRLQHKPEEGLEVIATGKLTTYPGSSKYQIVIENLEPAGAGALMALLEERKKKLEAEGLFAPERKQLLPFMPKRIGVVTSPTGAVIRDILHRIADRFPLHVMVWPVRVQGETTGAEVSHAINGFNAFDETVRPDIIIVARGGGSIEDLWGFNDEAVVRAAAASDIPLISAVGHETDWTLIDHAADVRAPTPTGAAELAVPVKVELEATIASYRARLQSAISGKLERARSSLVAARRGLASPDDLMAMPRRRLDDASGRLGRGLDLSVHTKRAQFEKTGARLSARSLVVSVGRYRDRLQHFSGQLAYAFRDQIRTSANSHERAERRLTQSLERIVRDKQTALEKIAARHSHKALENAVRQGTERLSGVFHRAGIAHRNTLGNAQTRLNALEKRLPSALTDALGEARRSFYHVDRLLENMSYKSALKRGYAVVRDENDRLVGRASEISRGETLQVEFADGRVLAIAGEKPARESPEPAKTPQKPLTRKDEKPLGADNQGSLF